MFPSASPPQILQSVQKDALIRSLLFSKVSSSLPILLALVSRRQLRNLQNFSEAIKVASDLVYYAMTTGLGIQTLGEEYAGILQIQSKSKSIPSLKSRIHLILLQCISPYILKLFILAIKCIPQSNPLQPYASRLVENQPFLQETLSTLSSLHLASFFLYGRFHNISKRVLGIEYIGLRKLRDGEEQLMNGYELLGVLILVRVAVKIGSAIYSKLMETINEEDESLNDADFLKNQSVVVAKPSQHVAASKEYVEPIIGTSDKCILCLEKRVQSTSSPCGHLFCWQCIAEWCRNKPECPLCRQSAPLPLLMPLYRIPIQ